MDIVFFSNLSTVLLKRAVRHGGRTIWMLLLAVAVCAGAYAQGYGTINGTVTDPSGAILPGATVSATNTSSGMTVTAVAGNNGQYVFPTLPPAGYTISVASPGFQTYSQKGIVLQANQALTVNVKMALGKASQTVTVSAGAPLVNTTNGTISQVVGHSRVVGLPLNGRNTASLITLVSGVAPAPSNGLDQGTTKTFPVAVAVTANGSQVNQTNYLLDGGNNVDEMTNVNGPFPFPEATQEFSVQTSNYGAQYGQSAGAVVNIVTRSGTQHFHGDLFEFLRNGFFDARSYFATVADQLHRNQFGGTIGGPVILPRISKGKTTQFFFGYQHTIIHQNSNAHTAVVPTPAEKGLSPSGAQLGYADFGSFCGSGFDASGTCTTPSQQIYNPFTGAKYANNQIPASALDPAAVAFEQQLPDPTTGKGVGGVGGQVNYFSPLNETLNEFLGRVDHSFGSHDHAFAHYYYDNFNRAGVYDPANLLSYQSFSDIRYQNALISETHIFGPHLLNNFVANYQREISTRGGPPGGPDITKYGVNIWQPTGVSNVLETVSVTNFFNISGSASAIFERNNYTFDDDLHWVKGRHNISFGGHVEISKFDTTNSYSSNGSFHFNTVGATSENPLANFEMGYMSSFTQGQYELVNDRNHFPGVFVQDDWRVMPRLSLNYGVRWEMFAAWHNRMGQQQLFNPADYRAGIGSPQYSTLPAGLFVSGDPGVPTNGVHNQYDKFMPRVGFAYDVFGNGKTAIRGGFGIFYEDRLQGFFNLSQSTNAPFTTTVSLTDPGASAASPGGPFSNPYCSPVNGTYTAPCSAGGQVGNPFPFSLPFPSNYPFPKPVTVDEYNPSGHFKVPVTDDFNLTFEQQLRPNWALSLAYVGSLSRHELVNLELNPAVDNGTKLGTDLRRVYNTPPVVGPCSTTAGCTGAYNDIVEADMSGAARYNSFQATLQKRMSKGFSILANYTFSKALDDLPYTLRVSNTQDLNGGESYVYPVYPPGLNTWYPPNYKALDIGRSDFDHPNAMSVSYVWNLPQMKNGNRLVRSVADGWVTSGLIQHHSGDALTVVAASDVSLTGLNQDRGVQMQGVSPYRRGANQGNCQSGHSCVNWLSPAAFTMPVNLGPNTGTGFGNVVKGSIRGPGYTNWDGAAMRNFYITHERYFQFRAEYFDLLNHTLLNDPNTSTPSPGSKTFGTITSENGAGPRIAQFSLKFIF